MDILVIIFWICNMINDLQKNIASNRSVQNETYASIWQASISSPSALRFHLDPFRGASEGSFHGCTSGQLDGWMVALT